MMRKGEGRYWTLIAAVVALLWAGQAVAQTHTARYRPPHPASAILSTSRPTDSLGDAVYDFLQPEERDKPAVPGAFLTPVVLQTVDPQYPETMRKAHKGGEVMVEGVVSQDGRFIDIKIVSASDPGFADSALNAASKYVFQPATLDGKPVACLLRVRVTYRIFSPWHQ